MKSALSDLSGDLRVGQQYVETMLLQPQDEILQHSLMADQSHG